MSLYFFTKVNNKYYVALEMTEKFNFMSNGFYERLKKEDATNKLLILNGGVLYDFKNTKVFDSKTN
jgi:hypothetical protein